MVSWTTHGQGRSAEICVAEELPCKWANQIAAARACQPRPWADANQTLVPRIQPRPPQPSSILQISKQEDTWISRAISTSPAVSIHCDWQVPRWSYLLIVRMSRLLMEKVELEVDLGSCWKVGFGLLCGRNYSKHEWARHWSEGMS